MHAWAKKLFVDDFEGCSERHRQHRPPFLVLDINPVPHVDLAVRHDLIRRELTSRMQGRVASLCDAGQVQALIIEGDNVLVNVEEESRHMA